MTNNTSTALPPTDAVCPELPFPVNMVVYERTQTTQLVTVLTSTLIALVCPFAVLGNTLVFLAVLRKTELRTVYNTSILFLAASDLAVGIISYPSFVVYQVSKLTAEHFSCPALVTYSSGVFVCTGFSILTLILITLERYLAIFHPYKYRDCVTRKRLVSIIACTWVIYGVLILLARFYFSASTVTYSIIATVLILGCVFITLYVYCKVYALAKRVRSSVSQQGSFDYNTSTNAITTTTTTTTTTTNSNSNSNSNSKNNNNNNKNQHNRVVNSTETKASNTVCYITGSVVLCFLPTVCASAVYQAMFLPSGVIYHVVYPLTDCAVLLSALLDPLIYVLRSRRVRDSLKQIIRRRVGTPEESSIDRRSRTAHSGGIELKTNEPTIS